MKLLTVSIIAFTFMTAPAAFATPVALADGGKVTTFSPSTPTFTGTFLDSYTMTYANAFENGTVLEDVYNNNGLLDFYYQVTDNASSSDSLSRVTVGNFTGFTTAVDYLTNGDDTPDSATRQTSGDSVGFNIEVDPGTTSDFLEVATNATAYSATGTISILDSLSTSFTNALDPSTSPAMDNAIPEPSTFALLGVGLLAAAGTLRRKLFSC